VRILSAAWECSRGWFGGLGMFVSRLLPELSALGHEVTHICLRGDFSGCVKNSFTECRFLEAVPSREFAIGVATAVALAAEALQLIYFSDAVIGHDMHGALVCATASEIGVKCLTYIHTFAGSGLELEGLSRCRRAANSKLTATAIESSFGVKIDKVVYPAPPYPVSTAVDTNKFRQPSEPLIVIPTRFQGNKDPKWVLEALRRLRERGYRFRAVMFGRGASIWPYRYEWLQILDDVPEEVKLDLYRSAHVVVYSSHFEPFGLPPLEAIAIGAPVLVHRNTGVSEVLSGLGVVDESSIEEALQQLLGDLTHAEELLYKQRELPIMKRAWRDVASEMLSLL